MKRVCLFINGLENSGGTERITTLVANELASRGFDVSIVTLQNERGRFFSLNTNIKIHCLSANRHLAKAVRVFISIKELRNYLINKKISTIISVDTLLSIYSIPACVGTKCKHISWEHFNVTVNLGLKSRDLSRLLSALVSNKILVLTEADKIAWQKKFPFVKNKISVISNPSFYEIKDEKYDIKKKEVLCIGRLTNQKGFDLMLNSWAKISENNPGWTLTIVGGGEDLDALTELAKELNITNSISFVGAVSNVATYYTEAAIFCLPSRYEGMCLVMLEAQSFGLPCVAYDCECGPAEVLDNGNGMLVKPFDVDEFAVSLNMLMNDDQLRANMSRKAIEKAKYYTIDSYMSRWFNIL